MTPDTWKIAGLVITALASVTGILGALYGIVTVPVLRTLKAEISGSELRLRAQIIEVEGRLNLNMLAMEKRLNERIDTRLVHR